MIFDMRRRAVDQRDCAQDGPLIRQPEAGAGESGIRSPASASDSAFGQQVVNCPAALSGSFLSLINALCVR